jgi:RNA polymerase sigma factor (sigma-70 family)
MPPKADRSTPTSKKSDASDTPTAKSSSGKGGKKAGVIAANPAEPFVQKTVHDYVELVETVARVECSRLPNHLIDYSELVNIGAIAIHVLLTNNPGVSYNVTYLSTAIKWAIRNELRYRYKWYALKNTPEATKDDTADGADGEVGDESADVEKTHVRESIYATILSVDGMMEADNPHELRDGAFTPEEASELKETAKIVRAAIEKLPEREKQIIEARFYKNMKMREIGEVYKISPSRISRIVQSGLDKIKVELLRRGYAA